jgi:hypothetical protein
MDPEKYKSGRELFDEIRADALRGTNTKEDVFYAAIMKILLDIREILIDSLVGEKPDEMP